MRTIVVSDATDIGNDTLRVRGLVETNGAPAPVVAYGWVSACRNHFPADAYTHALDADGKPNGQLIHKPAAKPRPMTTDEQDAYHRRLLLAAAPPELDQ